jgi:hypothetical protein
VAADGFHIPEGKKGHGVIDLTKIDIEALIESYNAGSRNIEASLPNS